MSGCLSKAGKEWTNDKNIIKSIKIVLNKLLQFI